jgi:hypothetical protein
MSPCGEGALQSRGTCWFFSIINGFLLSDAGQKILFDHLEKFYKGLSPAEKAQFDDGVPAPCVKSLMTAKRMYFYKFLDQYLCFRSGPRSASLKAGKSANILGGASLAGTLAKQNSGGKGAFPQEELPKILKHLGITDYIMTRHNAHMPVEDARKRPHFLVAVASKSSRVDRVPSFRPKTYSKMCCSVTIGNSNASNSLAHKYHAITGYVCNGKGYLFDSNQRKEFPCNWWVWNDLKRVVDNEVARHYDFFAGGQINYMGYNFVIFSRNDYIDSIKPVCRLKYKKTKTPFGLYTRVSNKNFNKHIQPGGAWNNLKPAQIAAIKRARARNKTKPATPIINKDAYNDILASSNSKQNALQKMRNLEQTGYRTNFTLLANFYKNLNAKYNTRSPENVFLTAKEMMSMAPTKSKRAIIYSSLYKNLPMHERKVLAHFRDHGVWHARNYYKHNSDRATPRPNPKPKPKPKPKSPSPKPNSPATARRKEVLAQFKPFWNGTTSNNHNTIRNYIAAHKSPIRKATSANRAVWNKYKSALENINALKTAKARAEWLKAKKLNFTKGNLQGLKNYVKGKNQANKNRRAAKKA